MSSREVDSAPDADQQARGKVRGQVFDAKGRTIAGATVTYDGETTMTLFDGTFEFSVLAPSTQTLTVTQKGYHQQSQKVDVRAGELTHVTFTLSVDQGSGTIYGYVYDSESQNPIPSGGAVIMVLPVENRFARINPTNGEYAFQDLSPGSYTIYASLLEYNDESRTITLKENEKKRVDFYCSRKAVEPPWG